MLPYSRITKFKLDVLKAKKDVSIEKSLLKQAKQEKQQRRAARATITSQRTNQNFNSINDHSLTSRDDLSSLASTSTMSTKMLVSASVISERTKRYKRNLQS